MTYRYDVANQLETAGSTTFTYDGNGNTETKTVTGATTTFTYDVKNRLTGISSGETSQYNADGLRVSYSNNPVASGTYAVQYDLAGNPVLDWNSGNAFQDYRVYGPGIDEVLAELHTGGTRKTFLHHDALGSVTAVSDASGLVAYRASYRAFGQMTRPTTSQLGYHPTRLGYTGREISTGTLMNYRSRHYDTATGRFLQEDVYRGNDIIPPSLHQYAYVHNNPVRYNDPTGHLPWPQMIAASLIAYIAFVVVGALLATALKLVDVCGRDNDCVSSFLESAFGHIQLVPIIGFFYLIIDIFTSGVINNPLEGVLWLFLSGLFALVVMEELITPWVAATFKTPLGRGAATIGALFAAQYIWSKFSWWFLSYNQRLVQQGTQQQQRGSQ